MLLSAGVGERTTNDLVISHALLPTATLGSKPANQRLVIRRCRGCNETLSKSISSSTHSKRGRCSICTLPSPIYNRILPPSLINTSLLSPRRLHLGEKSCTGGNFRFIRSTGLVRSFYYAAHSLILPVPQLARDRLQLSSSSTSSVICDSAELKYIH